MSHYLQRIALLCIVLTAGDTAAQKPPSPNKTSAKLTGTVTGSGGGPVLGAGIKIEDHGNRLITSTLSGPDGEYEIDGLVEGYTYNALFCAKGYQPTVDIIKPTTKTDIKLSPLNDPKFFKAEAETFIKDFQGTKKTDDPETFATKWGEFEASGPSAQGKTYIAKEIKKDLNQPKLWANIQSFTAYANADPEKVDSADRSVWINASDPAVAALNPVIVQDMLSNKIKLQPLIDGARLSPRDPCSNPRTVGTP